MRLLAENSRYFNVSYGPYVSQVDHLEAYFDDEMAKILRPGYLQKLAKSAPSKAKAPPATPPQPKAAKTEAKTPKEEPKEEPKPEPPRTPTIKIKFRLG